MKYSEETKEKLMGILKKFPAMSEEDILLFGIEALERMYEMAEEGVGE